MLKDNFSRKPKKTVQPRQFPVPKGLPELDPSAFVPSSGFAPAQSSAAPLSAPDQPRTGQPDAQQMAALALGRLAGTFSETKAPQPAAESADPATTPKLFGGGDMTNGSQQPMPAGRFQQIQPCESSGKIINELYLIKGQLGRGGMGQVLLCRRLDRDVDVVMKLMLSEANPDDRKFQRFLQECKAAHRIQHRNVVTVMDYGILLDGLQPYLVMEFVDGFSLRQLLRGRGAITPSEIAEILIQACNGLHEVHGRGVIHRDLKPDNIMIETDDNVIRNVKILDFGIAQLLRKNIVDDQGLAVGSVMYMSPEQACGKPVDHRTDIYSLGAILYEAICSVPPFRGKNASETMAMHVTAPVTPVSAVASCPHVELVDAICLRALAKNPADRYQTAAEMQMDLARLLS